MAQHRPSCTAIGAAGVCGGEAILILSQISLQENSLSILLGEQSGESHSAGPLRSSRAAQSAQIPVGLPSELLERRPDIGKPRQRWWRER